MWRALGDTLRHQPWSYVCNCGPHCTPALRRLTEVDGPDEERVREATTQGSLPL